MNKWVPEQKREEQQIRDEQRDQRIHVIPQPTPPQPLPEVLPPLLGTPPGWLHPSGQHKRRRLKVGALAPPRGFREAEAGEPPEEEGEAPPEVEERRAFAAEDGRVVPPEVAGDVSGDEELGVEGRSGSGGGFNEDVGNGLEPLFPCGVAVHCRLRSRDHCGLSCEISGKQRRGFG